MNYKYYEEKYLRELFLELLSCREGLIEGEKILFIELKTNYKNGVSVLIGHTSERRQIYYEINCNKIAKVKRDLDEIYKICLNRKMLKFMENIDGK